MSLCECNEQDTQVFSAKGQMRIGRLAFLYMAQL